MTARAAVHRSPGQTTVRQCWPVPGEPGYTRDAMAAGSAGRRVGSGAVWLALAIVVACKSGPPNPYPDEVVDNFVVACRTNADERVCRCAIDRIQRRWSLDEFRAFEARLSQGDVPKELMDSVAGCRDSR